MRSLRGIMPIGYPTLTCLQDYLDVYGERTGATWADVPLEYHATVYSGADRCRIETLNRYCDEGYADACAEVGRAVDVGSLANPDKETPGFLDVLPGVAADRLGSPGAIADTLREGAAEVRNVVGAGVGAGLSIFEGAGSALPDLPPLPSAGKWLIGAGIAAAAVYLVFRFKR